MKLILSALGAILVSSFCAAEKPNNEVIPTSDKNVSRKLGVCNGNLVVNYNGIKIESGHPLHNWRGMRSVLSSVPDSFVEESRGFKITDRFDLNSGLAQIMSAERIECLTEGEDATFSFYMKLEDTQGNPFVCTTPIWNQPESCPLLSFRIQKQDGSSTWFNVRNQSGEDWKADGWNKYTATFKINADLGNANSVYFTVRGTAQPINYIVSDVKFVAHAYETDKPSPGTGSGAEAPAASPQNPVTPSPTTEFVKESDSNKEAVLGPEEDVVDLEPYVSPKADLCDVGLDNGFFEDGKFDPSPWSVHLGGVLSVYDIAGEIDDDHKFALKISGRTSPHHGPKHPISIDCFEADRVFEVKALIKMVEESTGAPYGCDPKGSTNSTCPILTVETIYDQGEPKYLYSSNLALYEWKADKFNEFHGYFKVSENMTTANTANLYFERPPAGVDLIIDDIVVKEFQPVPVGNLYVEGNDEVSPDCEVIVTNGNAEFGDTSGWTSRLGGHLSIRPEGADQTEFSFEHGGRSSFIMGPKHVLKTQCFVEGLRYSFDAKMKLVDEDGLPYGCDKLHTYIDDKSCPLLTFQMEGPQGKSWKYFGNQAPGAWEASMWNSFHTFFIVTPEIAEAQNSYFYIERPRAGVNIIIDQVVISRDCTALVPNSNAESGVLAGWKVKNGAGGYIDIYDDGHNSTKSYGHFDRQSPGGGPSHKLDLGCLVKGQQYKFSAKFKLFDQINGDAPFECKKNVPWGDPNLCPIFAIDIVSKDGQGENAGNFLNLDPTSWNATGFNDYWAYFTVTDVLASAKEAYIIIKGLRTGIAMLFDDVVVESYDPPEYDCDKMIPNGDFEYDDISGWSIRQSGTLDIFNDGADSTENSLKISDRQMSGAGFKVNLNTTCLVEGKRYEFKAQTKLIDGNGQPFACVASKGYNDPLACPLLGFEFTNDGLSDVKHYSNDNPAEYEADDWNHYRAVFTITHQLATAESAFLMIQGPAPDVDILIDRVTLKIHQPPQANCGQLVVNNNAEHDSLQGWTVNRGGYISILEEGYGGSNHSFVNTHRDANYFGPAQHLPMSCLSIEGNRFVFLAQLKLLDENGNPFACDKSAAWNTPKTCPLLSFEATKHDGSFKRTHYGNFDTSAWKADGWNEYRTNVRVTQDMTEAETVFFYLQGPAPGIQIIFDRVALRAQEITS